MSYEKALAHRLVAHDFGLYASFDRNEAYMRARWPRDTFRWEASSDVMAQGWYDDEFGTVQEVYDALAYCAANNR